MMTNEEKEFLQMALFVIHGNIRLIRIHKTENIDHIGEAISSIASAFKLGEEEDDNK